jgi:parvulin-like peptidyl-prolyl isomerase
MGRIPFIAFLIFLITTHAGAEVIDRVVAFIDNTAITQSELEQAYQKSAAVVPDITRREVLQTMINHFLILREAHQLRLEAPTEDELINEYIEIKVKAFIRISDEQVEQYYRDNIEHFTGVNYSDAKAQIEALQFEKELNKRLKQHIETIRKGAYIKIFLD